MSLYSGSAPGPLTFHVCVSYSLLRFKCLQKSAITSYSNLYLSPPMQCTLPDKPLDNSRVRAVFPHPKYILKHAQPLCSILICAETEKKQQ